LSHAEVAHHPESPRANYALGRLYFSAIENGTGKQAVMFKKARQYFANASLADADYTEGLFGLITLYEYTDRSRPAGIVDILAKRLRNAPFANNNGNMLAQLVTCQEQQKCRLTRAEMGKLLQAALRNPTLAGSNKASVLTSTSRYFAMQGQYQVALKLARQAVQAVPDSIVHRLNVVHWLITMGKAEQARQALSEIKSMDTLHRHAKYIREQEQMLHDLEFIQRFSGK
jgi:tetratricopeptide (TPR) repeat protein